MAESAANFYEILGCSETATFEQLKSKYKQLVLQCHPDKLTEPPASSSSSADEERFIRINRAWNTLKDPTKRKLYDAELCQSRFHMHSNVFDRLRLADMTTETCTDDDGAVRTVRTHRCRCGGQYIVDDDEAAVPTTHDDDDDDELLIECSECSLVIVLRK